MCDKTHDHVPLPPFSSGVKKKKRRKKKKNCNRLLKLTGFFCRVCRQVRRRYAAMHFARRCRAVDGG